MTPGTRQPEAFDCGQVPPVDPEDLKRVWEFCHQQGNQRERVVFGLRVLEAICSPGANIFAVNQRNSFLWMMQLHELLTPWQHGEELDDKVFRAMATFPVESMKVGVRYDKLPFDGDAFLQKLREDTGA